MSWAGSLEPRTVSSHRHEGYTIDQMEENWFDPSRPDNVGRGRYWRIRELEYHTATLRAAIQVISERSAR